MEPRGPVTLQASSVSAFLGASEVLRPLAEQLPRAQVSPNESQQQEMAIQAEMSSKSPKERKALGRALSWRGLEKELWGEGIP